MSPAEATRGAGAAELKEMPRRAPRRDSTSEVSGALMLAVRAHEQRSRPDVAHSPQSAPELAGAALCLVASPGVLSQVDRGLWKLIKNKPRTGNSQGNE